MATIRRVSPIFRVGRTQHREEVSRERVRGILLRNREFVQVESATKGYV